MFGLQVSLGMVLFGLGLFAELLIKRKLMVGGGGGGGRGGPGGGGGGSAALIKPYSWIAWISTLAGSILLSATWGNPFGIQPLAAFGIIVAGGMVVAIDLRDRRPDWPAFLIIAGLPFVARIPAGPVGSLLHVVVDAAATLVTWVGHLIGA